MKPLENAKQTIQVLSVLLLGTLAYDSANAADARLNTISVSPLAAVSGQKVTGTIRMTESCPSSGCTIALKSSNATAAPIQSSLFIARGSSSGSFSFTAGSVSSKSIVTLTASYAGSSRSTGTTFSVSPSTTAPAPTPTELAPAPAPSYPADTSTTLDGIEMDSWTGTGGKWVYGTVHLKAAAASALTVSLSSSSPLAPVPPSITIPAGAKKQYFTFNAGMPSSKAVVIITATVADGFVNTKADFSIVPSLVKASPLSPNPNVYDGRNHQVIQPMDVCFYFDHCGLEQDSTVSMVDMPETHYPYSPYRSHGLSAVGTFSVIPSTTTYRSGGYYSQVWGYQSGIETWSRFFLDMYAFSRDCKTKAEMNGARSYTWGPVARASGGHYKQFTSIYPRDFYGNLMATPQMFHDYGRTFRCSY